MSTCPELRCLYISRASRARSSPLITHPISILFPKYLSAIQIYYKQAPELETYLSADPHQVGSPRPTCLCCSILPKLCIIDDRSCADACGTQIHFRALGKMFMFCSLHCFLPTWGVSSSNSHQVLRLLISKPRIFGLHGCRAEMKTLHSRRTPAWLYFYLCMAEHVILHPTMYMTGLQHYSK
jgi:hypothetical protein